MKAKITRGKGFGGILEYALEDAKAVGIVGGNMSGRDGSELKDEFKAVRRIRPDVEKPVWHCSLSLPPGEQIDNNRWARIVDDFTERLGLDANQCVAVKHGDTDHEHVHIIANRISPDGSLWYGQGDVWKAMRATAAMEPKFGLSLTPSFEQTGPRQVAELTKNEMEMNARTGEMPPRAVIQQTIDAALEGAPTADAFVDRLENAGIGVHASYQSTGLKGLSFEFNGVRFSGKKLGAAYTWGKLRKRGVDYEPGRDDPRISEASERAKAPSREDPSAERAGLGGHSGVDGDGLDSDRRPDRNEPEPGREDDALAAEGGREKDERLERGAPEGTETGNEVGQVHGDGLERAGERTGAHLAGDIGAHRMAEREGVVRPGGDWGDDRVSRWGNAVERVSAIASDLKGASQRGLGTVMRQVQRLAQAFGDTRFEVGVRDEETGKTFNRSLDLAEDGESTVRWLRSQNARGQHIYVRPDAEEHPFVMVDDLTKSGIDEMQSAGYAPAITVETSPGNYQAWVRLSDEPVSPEIRKDAAKHLAEVFEGDPGSADHRHYGRMPGFSNPKPEHQLDNGQQPFSKLQARNGHTAQRGPALVANLEAQHEEKAKIKQEIEAPTPQPGKPRRRREMAGPGM